MTSSQSEETAGYSESLQRLIAESGHTASERIAEFTDLASSVQRQRRSMGVSDSDGITRTVGLWALMQLDEDIKEVLERFGVNQTALAGALSLLSP